MHSGDSTRDTHILTWLGDLEQAQRLASDRTRLQNAQVSDDDLLASDFTVPPTISIKESAQILEVMMVVGYKLEGRIDDHSNSQVYRARRLANNSHVAVKVVLDHPGDRSSAVRRFRQEARLLLTLNHPGVVRAIAYGGVHGVNYLVLELATGRNLRQVVDAAGPMPVDQAAKIAYQAADALEYLHQHGVIHRDIKPSNFILSSSGAVKLLDLGLARSSRAVPDNSITILYNDRLLGTPDFMAPEQAIDCHLVDPRADIYALGCTLYFLLAGRPPLVGKNIVDCLLKHQHARPAPLSELRPDVPRSLSEICERLMAKRPDDRFERAADVAAALSPWAGE